MAVELKPRERPYFGLTADREATPVTYPGDRHIVLFGAARGGKDSGLITPNLARLRRSVFVIDPRGEQAAITARARAKFSRVIPINPFELLTDTHPHLKSQGFNCVALPDFDPASRDFNDNACGFGDALVKIDGNEPHFALGGKALVSALSMWERIKRGPGASLRNVRKMLTAPYGVEDGKPIGLYRRRSPRQGRERTRRARRKARNAAA